VKSSINFLLCKCESSNFISFRFGLVWAGCFAFFQNKTCNSCARNDKEWNGVLRRFKKARKKLTADEI
jgi:hypothetical protein